MSDLIALAERAATGEVVEAFTFGGGPLGALGRAIHAAGRSVSERDQTLRHDHHVSAIDSQLQRAFDLCDNETEAISVIERALTQVVPETPAEVLLADSSRAHLRPVTVGSADLEAPGCPVERPFQCAAVRRGQTLVFESSEALDACPKLREHVGGECSAVCSPLTVMGNTIGVLHTIRRSAERSTPEQVELLEIVATQAGMRLGMLRTLATTQLQASTDPLTGLLNRRSFEENATKVFRGEPGDHTVVMCDLDHFKRLNDTHGHDAGDRALKLFADTMKAALRPADVVGRHGGEEFVILLPSCSVEQGVAVLERLRARLASAVERYGGPAYTASFGVAPCGDGAELPEVMERADRALYNAKRRGRDCVATTEDVDPAPVSASKPSAAA